MNNVVTITYKLRTYESFPTETSKAYSSVKLCLTSDRKSKFEIYLNGKSLGFVASPIYDGARILLKMGFDPDTLLTTQSQYSNFPSWKPQPIWKWAKLTVKERDATGLATETFTQFPGRGVLAA